MRILKKEKLLQRHMINAQTAEDLLPRGSLQLHILIEALAAANRAIERLVVHLWGVNMSHSGFLKALTPKLRTLATTVMARLKMIHLEIAPVSSLVLERLNAKKDSYETSLTTILKAATILETLSICFRKFDDHLECWRDYIHTPRFGRLKLIYIENVTFHEVDFASFLLKSGQGLQTLGIKNGKVAEGSWNHIFETIKGLPQLKSVWLYCLWEESDQGDFWALEDWEKMDPQPLYDYLLNKRPDNPWDAMCKSYQTPIEDSEHVLRALGGGFEDLEDDPFGDLDDDDGGYDPGFSVEVNPTPNADGRHALECVPS